MSEHQQHQNSTNGNATLNLDSNSNSNSNSNNNNINSETATNNNNNSNNNSNNDDNRPKRNPFCSRCRNHGKKAQVKGHKRHCEYRDCHCEGCQLVEFRQVVSAAQIKRRRYQKQDEESGRKIEISPPKFIRDHPTPATVMASSLLAAAAASAQPPTAAVVTATNAAAVMAAAAAAANVTATTSVPTLPVLGNTVSPNHHAHVHAHQHAHAHAQLHSSLHAQHVQQHHNSQSTHAVPAAANATPSNAHHRHHHTPTSLTQAHAINIALTNSLNTTAHQQLNSNNQSPNSIASVASVNSIASGNDGGVTNNSSAILNANSAGASTPNPLSASASTPPPSPVRQIELIEELSKMGPLVVFAWLKAENFNVNRLRDLIQAAEISFNELQEFKSKQTQLSLATLNALPAAAHGFNYIDFMSAVAAHHLPQNHHSHHSHPHHHLHHNNHHHSLAAAAASVSHHQSHQQQQQLRHFQLQQQAQSQHHHAPF